MNDADINYRLVNEVMRRVVEGIPSCTRCGNTDRDRWIIDVTGDVAMEECAVCNLRRPILPEEIVQ